MPKVISGTHMKMISGVITGFSVGCHGGENKQQKSRNMLDTPAFRNFQTCRPYDAAT